MANWQHTLDLKDIWDRHSDKDPVEIDYEKQGKAVAARIREAGFYKEFEDDLEEVAILFDESDDQASFDYAYSDLCDWGDIKLPTPKGQMQRKMAWIKTF